MIYKKEENVQNDFAMIYDQVRTDIRYHVNSLWNVGNYQKENSS